MALDTHPETARNKTKRALDLFYYYYRSWIRSVFCTQHLSVLGAKRIPKMSLAPF